MNSPNEDSFQLKRHSDVTKKQLTYKRLVFPSGACADVGLTISGWKLLGC